MTESVDRRTPAPCDSTGTPIKVGDKVRFRGHDYVIKGFIAGKGTHGTAAIEFTTARNTPEVADETSVDLISN